MKDTVTEEQAAMSLSVVSLLELRGILSVWRLGPQVRCVALLGGTVLTLGVVRSVVWTKNNPTPWNTIKPEEGTKILSINQKFEKRCARAVFSCCAPCSLYLSLFIQLVSRQALRDSAASFLSHSHILFSSTRVVPSNFRRNALFFLSNASAPG